MLDGLVGGEICWVGIGGDSKLFLKDSGKVAFLCDVTLQSGYPRNVVKLEQIFDSPSHDDIWIVVESGT